MLKGLYTAYSGMINEQNRMDVLTNNLANAATTGFKKEGTTSQGFDNVLAYRIKDLTGNGLPNSAWIGVGTPGVKLGETFTDFSQGAFHETGNTYDFALSGDGFFNIEFTSKTGEKTIMYTRDGSFTLTKECVLVTQVGAFAMGEGANGEAVKIQLDPTQPANIDRSGRIVQGDEVKGQLKLTDFEDMNFIEHYGENFYRPVEGATFKEADAEVYSGYLETSNVQVVSEMVNLISVTRQYESNQKIVQAYDESLEIAVNQIGKL
ncbi:MAG: flagellar hook-basal body protein [Lachnospiraceae bacterium]|nr:flagellar hook-basal body protein [Lachnospiraceae bacterium]